MKIKSSIVIVAICSILNYWTAFDCFGGNFMREIPLTQGKHALVDDADYEFLMQWKWFANTMKIGYSIAVSKGPIKGKATKMHRLILSLTNPKIQVDHIDGNPLNNQRSNLRACTIAQNQMNKRSNINSLSKYKGVGQYKSNNRWYASIRLNQKPYFLGIFANEVDAAIAYNEAAKKMFGEFARLNQVPERNKGLISNTQQ